MVSRFSRVALALLSALPIGAITAQEPTQLTITGRVTTEAGMVVPRANVFLEGLNLATQANDDGRYSLIVAPARVRSQLASITARALGFRAATRQIRLTGAEITQDFALVANPLRLGEMVVTGAGTTSTAEKLGNTVNSVKADAIARSNEQNLVNALAGQAPNVQVISQSGDPGASASIRIRGSKTITGTGQPLFVVDGVPIDNTTTSTGGMTASTVAPNRASDINPDDIESVEILKGAASGAIYGARAGQGVILITTKHGRAGATRYTLGSKATIDRATTDYPLQTRYGQGVNWTSSTCTTPNCFVASTNSASSFGPEITAGQPRYNHANELFETGGQLDNSLTASGGSDRTQFFFSGSQYDARGVIVGPNDSYNRYTARLNASHQLTNDLRLGGNISYVDTRGSFIQKGSNTSGLLLGGLRSPPDFNNLPYLDSLTGLQRSFRFPNPTVTSGVTSRGYDNPFFSIYQQSNKANSNRSFGNIQADWVPSGWLSFKYSLGVDANAEARLQAIPKTSASFPTGQVLSSQFTQSQIDHNLVGTATWSLNSNFGGTVVLGQNLNARRFQQEFVQGNTLLADEPFKLTNTLQQVNVTDAETRVHTEGYFSQATFDVYDQLHLTLGLRNDGSSTFSDDSRRNWFPKASAAWTFTNHLSALGLDRLISFGKLRAAYGEVGQEPGAYQLLSVLQAGANLADGGWATQVQATQNNIAALFSSGTKGQPSIKPERTSELEAGIDIGLFGDRADAGLTFYNALSRDVIFATPLAPSSGFTTQVRNAGKIRNRGWEATLNVRPINRPNLGWDLGFQWATNDNKVLELVGAQFVNMGGSFTGTVGAASVGGRVGGLRGFDWIRCGRADAAIGESGRTVTMEQVTSACTGAANGALFIAADGFPVVDGTERQIMDPQPRWTGSINNSLRFKKIRVTGLLDIKQGGQVWNGTKGALYFFGTHKDTEDGRNGQKVFGETWGPKESVVGPGANKPVYLVCPPGTGNCNGNGITNWFQGNGGGFGSQTAQSMEDGSYVKLREIAVAFTLDRPWVASRLGLTSVEVKLAARNLHTWTKYTGWDPETNLAGAEAGITGVDFFNNPQTRSFVLALTLNR